MSRFVIGEAENVFPELIDDYRRGQPRDCYQGSGRPRLDGVTPDRTLFAGKGYLPVRLVEFARGCRFECEFCSVNSFFHAMQNHRPVDEVVEELHRLRTRYGMFFFIDDNLTSDIAAAKELMRALIPLGVRWVSQSSIVVARSPPVLLRTLWSRFVPACASALWRGDGLADRGCPRGPGGPG